MKKIIKKIFEISRIISIVFVLHCCIDDNILPPLTGKLNPTAELLVYFETIGDFANSELAPALIDAEEVFANINNYLIIDVRDNSDFMAGHIEGAVNVQNDSLYSYIKNLNQNLYPKVVLVSSNGHRSAYYVCLLRLSGFNNIYTLNFGMAAWNINFADEWLNALKNDSARISFNNNYYPKGEFTNLPEIIFENPTASLQERVEKRIESFIKTGFTKVNQYRSRFYFFSNDFLVCYGKSRLYRSPISAAVDPGRGHAAGTIHYADEQFFELRSVQYLQTLPTDRAILIYGYNGQLSACMTAYLRVLGYDAISLEFGANQIFYNRMLDDPELYAYAFDHTDIKNFPYVIGN